MRIIEENKNEEIIQTCSCGCKFAYTEDDVYSNIHGEVVECPSCGEKIIIKEFNRPLQFPESYFHYGDKNSKIVDNKTIEREVKRCIKYCLEHNECQWYTAYGNMFIEVNWMVDDGFEVLVAQNYYDNHISEEEAKELIANFNY